MRKMPTRICKLHNDQWLVTNVKCFKVLYSITSKSESLVLATGSSTCWIYPPSLRLHETGARKIKVSFHFNLPGRDNGRLQDRLDESQLVGMNVVRPITRRQRALELQALSLYWRPSLSQADRYDDIETEDRRWFMLEIQ
ncbi:hypothetical protein CY34DRAFT_711853 [Suillus luteus UH-Slu-Lm8-n1]|uniref:Uncharacterized protein n=1 Tax=Suillus luteus UH-Slu-Lm8-n1 TaxID=930992 RepID=A0A0D0A5F1_9AGAM|nr:hypothetical protein CY34DRAFT_711853 [Suillus luteus UH-Slu-Lm8-n1]